MRITFGNSTPQKAPAPKPQTPAGKPESQPVTDPPPPAENPPEESKALPVPDFQKSKYKGCFPFKSIIPVKDNQPKKDDAVNPNDKPESQPLPARERRGGCGGW